MIARPWHQLGRQPSPGLQAFRQQALERDEICPHDPGRGLQTERRSEGERTVSCYLRRVALCVWLVSWLLGNNSNTEASSPSSLLLELNDGEWNSHNRGAWCFMPRPEKGGVTRGVFLKCWLVLPQAAHHVLCAWHKGSVLKNFRNNSCGCAVQVFHKLP